MNINSHQSISHRDSIASDFVSQTLQSSSMLSSRRRAIDDADNDLDEFKEEIQNRFTRSVANKTYTYPVNEEGFDYFDDEEEFTDLIGVYQYNLLDQDRRNNQNGFKKQQFKIKNAKVSKTVGYLLESLKSQRQRLSNLRQIVTQSSQSKNFNKQRGFVLGQSVERSGREEKKYVQDESQTEVNYRKKRLNTQPYEKPMGFIIKKK